MRVTGSIFNRRDLKLSDIVSNKITVMNLKFKKKIKDFRNNGDYPLEEICHLQLYYYCQSHINSGTNVLK